MPARPVAVAVAVAVEILQDLGQLIDGFSRMSAAKENEPSVIFTDAHRFLDMIDIWDELKYCS